MLKTPTTEILIQSGIDKKRNGNNYKYEFNIQAISPKSTKKEVEVLDDF